MGVIRKAWAAFTGQMPTQSKDKNVNAAILSFTAVGLPWLAGAKVLKHWDWKCHLSLAWCKIKGLHECQISLNREGENPCAYVPYCAPWPRLSLVSSTVTVMGVAGGWSRSKWEWERVVYGVLHAFTFDLPIITIGFTFNDSVTKPIF